MSQSELLARLENDLSDILKRVRTGFAERPKEALLLRTKPDKWNILDHFAHLNAQFDYYLPRIELALHKAKARQWRQDTERRSNWLGRRAIRSADPVYMDVNPRRSPKNIDPKRTLTVREHELKAFLINIELLLRLVKQAQEVDLNRAKVKPMRWSLYAFLSGDLFEYLTLHTQRHLLHIEKMMNDE
ncbi:MAG: DinB family protein [Saprospiraceae bacterium]|nr:DinB family protein [Saprospiraceae bacterium]